ncbi:MAG: hypothetical protein Kow001_16410 [Acidobacteriota bacterium]
MPGPIVHLIVQQRLRRYLPEFGGAQGKELSSLLGESPCSPYAGFGSMGPDFLFFSLKEYGTPLDEFANFIFGVYDAFEPLIEFYENTIEPVVASIENAIMTADEILFQGLFQQIKDTADLATSAALNAAGVVVTQNIDLFYPFYPKIQDGAKETDWYWFDFLHYRRTGRFASTMWNMAGGDKDLRRYVIGYASHIATDVVGHPFVNAVTGGPYRMHWHRHKVVENWIDAYARKRYSDSSSLKKCLKLGAGDIYVPDSIAGSYYSRLTEFPGKKLPQKLADLLADAMKQVYSDIDHPEFLDPADLDTTYRLWLLWFERSTSIGDAQKPTPVPPPGSAALDLLTDFASGFPTPSGGGGGGGGGFSVWDIFAAIFAFVKWLVEVLAYTLTWIITHAIDIISLPLTTALEMLKWLLYQIQKAIWEIYDNLRFLLVLGGYLFPEARDLQKSPWGLALLNTAFVHLTGGVGANFNLYPRKQEVHNLGGPIEHHLLYQGTLQEKPHAEPAPLPFHGFFPEAFIDKGYTFDPFIETLYSCKTPYLAPGGSPNDATHEVDKMTWNTGQLGNALVFSARLIATRIADLPNFNLDGDRGYGWKTWRADRPETINADPEVPVQYIDA